MHISVLNKNLTTTCSQPASLVEHFQIYCNYSQVTDAGNLVIKNLSWREMGEYTCRAENAFGVCMHTSYLFIQILFMEIKPVELSFNDFQL